MNKKKLFWILGAVVVLVAAVLLTIWLICRNKKVEHEGLNQRKYQVEEKAVQDTIEEIAKNINVKVIRFDQDVYHLDTNHLQEGIRKLGKKYHGIFIDSTAWHYQEAAWQMKNFLTDPYFVELYKYVNQKYADMSDVEEELKNALAYYRYYFPEIQIPTIYSVVGGIDADSYTKLVEGQIVKGKMTLILHLDWYLGKGNKYYGALPQYIRYQCDKRFLAIDCFRNVLVWEQLPNKEPITLLDNMLAAGKVLYFTEMLFPNRPIEDIFAYTNEQLQWAEQHHGDVWNYLIENELVYSKDASVAQHMIDVAPETKPFKGSPGRMGAFIGWKIVCNFMENHPEISLQEMMKMDDMNEMLKKSGYKPKK
jgi:hypothetical protein